MQLSSYQINWLLGAIAENANEFTATGLYKAQEEWQERFPDQNHVIDIPNHIFLEHNHPVVETYRIPETAQ